MNKKISKIPRFAYLEAQILHKAKKQGLFDAIVRSVEYEQGLPSGSLESGIYYETRVLSLLYSLIVVPKEFWNLGESHPIYAQISESWSIRDVTVILDRSDFEDPIYKFIHHLRNAIAHANFEFRDTAFEFWDQWKTKPEKYRASLSKEKMQHFLEVVGSLLANVE